jgi:hypothetical protein
MTSPNKCLVVKATLTTQQAPARDLIPQSASLCVATGACSGTAPMRGSDGLVGVTEKVSDRVRCYQPSVPFQPQLGRGRSLGTSSGAVHR